MDDLSRRNRRTVLASVTVIAMMGGLVYYSVPLYRMFCQVTGFGGTTQSAEAAPGVVGERIITVRFDATTSARLPWKFGPAQRQMRVRIGERAHATYIAKNLSDKASVGSASFNVTPAKAGQYFTKIECFCFTEQRLAAGARAEMGVDFFIDPAILDDRSLDDVGTITLSYTMYRKADRDGEEQTLASGDDSVEPGPTGRKWAGRN